MRSFIIRYVYCPGGLIRRRWKDHRARRFVVAHRSA